MLVFAGPVLQSCQMDAAKSFVLQSFHVFLACLESVQLDLHNISKTLHAIWPILAHEFCCVHTAMLWNVFTVHALTETAHQCKKALSRGWR